MNYKRVSEESSSYKIGGCPIYTRIQQTHNHLIQSENHVHSTILRAHKSVELLDNVPMERSQAIQEEFGLDEF